MNLRTRGSRQAFSLVEILVVVTIIAVLSCLAVAAIREVLFNARMVDATNRMRQWGTALIAFESQNNGQLPSEGNSNPAIGETVPLDEGVPAWYNALPQIIGKNGVQDMTTVAQFYRSDSMFYVAAAQYANQNALYFPISYCSKLQSSTVKIINVRQPCFKAAPITVVFQESGVPGETPLSGQSAYDGQAKSYASRTAARYHGKTMIAFADGHVESLKATDVVTSKGKSYNPQSGGKVCWTLDPSADPSNKNF